MRGTPGTQPALSDVTYRLGTLCSESGPRGEGKGDAALAGGPGTAHVAKGPREKFVGETRCGMPGGARARGVRGGDSVGCVGSARGREEDRAGDGDGGRSPRRTQLLCGLRRGRRHLSHASASGVFAPAAASPPASCHQARPRERVSPALRVLGCPHTTWQMPAERLVPGGLAHSRCLVCV